MRTTKTPDMSPEAIDRRLREVSELHRLGMTIKRAKRVGKIDQACLEQIDAPAERLEDRP